MLACRSKNWLYVKYNSMQNIMVVIYGVSFAGWYDA